MRSGHTDSTGGDAEVVGRVRCKIDSPLPQSIGRGVEAAVEGVILSRPLYLTAFLSTLPLSLMYF